MREKTEPDDLFRDTVLRYTAFTSDLGEALRPFLPKIVYLGSYGIVAAYAISDSVNRGFKQYWRSPKPQRYVVLSSSGAGHPSGPNSPQCIRITRPAPLERTNQLGPVAATVVDSLLWHAAASLFIPYVIINRTVWASTRLVDCHPKWKTAPRARHVLPTLTGLAVIPLVVPHVDAIVTHVMDACVRPHLLPSRDGDASE